VKKRWKTKGKLRENQKSTVKKFPLFPVENKKRGKQDKNRDFFHFYFKGFPSAIFLEPQG
jgi:hypothetical protein